MRREKVSIEFSRRRLQLSAQVAISPRGQSAMIFGARSAPSSQKGDVEVHPTARVNLAYACRAKAGDIGNLRIAAVTNRGADSST
jgi:hypothetical protein